MRALIFTLFATTATAETPMTAAEFEAYVTGKILTFGSPKIGNYGVEQYLPDRRVRWSALDGECIKGEWYAEGDDICFLYVGDPEPKCWEVYQTSDGIRAEYTSTDSGTILFEAKEDPEALICGDLFS